MADKVIPPWSRPVKGRTGAKERAPVLEMNTRTRQDGRPPSRTRRPVGYEAAGSSTEESGSSPVPKPPTTANRSRSTTVTRLVPNWDT